MIVTFTIDRDGSVPPQSVRVTAIERHNRALDISAKRAILEATPFPALPQQFGRNSADVEFYFRG